MTHAFQFVFIWCDKQSVELSFINPFLSSEIIYPNKSLATLLNGAREKKCIKIDCLKEKCFGIRQWVKLVIDNKLITFCALGVTHHVVQFHRNLNHLSVESCCDVLKSYTPISHWQLPWTVLQKKKCIKIYCSKEKCFGKRQWVELVIDNKLITFCALGATHLLSELRRGRLPIKITFETSHVYWLMRRKLKGSQLNFNDRLQ